MADNPFDSRVLTWVIVATVSLLVVSWIADIFATDLFGNKSSASDTYSRSAIGHKALVQTLEALGIPTLISRRQSDLDWLEGGLVIAEPQLNSDDDKNRLANLLDRSGAVLIVLPKWIGLPSFEDRGHVGKVEDVMHERRVDVLKTLNENQNWDVRSPGIAETGSFLTIWQ